MTTIYSNNLWKGRTLVSNHPQFNKLISGNGRYMLILQGDGALVHCEVRPGTAERIRDIWWNAIHGTEGPYTLFFQADGNITVRDRNNNQIWATNQDVLFVGTKWMKSDTLWVPDGGQSPEVHGGGEYFLIAPPRRADTLYAGSILQSEQSVMSQDYNIRLKMQDDGNLVLARRKESYNVWLGESNEKWPANWASGTAHGRGPFTLYYQGDGNMVIRNGDNNVHWDMQKHYSEAYRSRYATVTNNQEVHFFDKNGVFLFRF